MERKPSRVALAGYSMGATTVQLAAGQVMRANGASGTVVDLTTEGLRRVDDNGTPSNLDDDSGPFLDVDAFLSISGEEWAQPEQLFVLNDAKPVISGRDYIQRPFMMTTGSLDFLQHKTTGAGRADATSDATFYDPVTNAAGINDAPAYGLVIDQGNHITPVGVFDSPQLDVLAWKPDSSTPAAVLDWTTNFGPYIGSEHMTAQESTDLRSQGTHKAIVEELFEAFVGGFLEIEVEEPQARDQMTDGLLKYTLSFFDAFLSRNYDAQAAQAFLDQDPDDHMDTAIVFDMERDDLNPTLDSNGQRVGFGSSRTSLYSVQNQSGSPLVHFTADGDVLLLEGSFLEQQTISATSNSELLVKNQSGTIIMSVDSVSGNMKIKGTLTEEDTDLYRSASQQSQELVIRHNADDPATNDKIILEESGDMILRGLLYSTKVDILDP